MFTSFVDGDDVKFLANVSNKPRDRTRKSSVSCKGFIENIFLMNS